MEKEEFCSSLGSAGLFYCSSLEGGDITCGAFMTLCMTLSNENNFRDTQSEKIDREPEIILTAPPSLPVRLIPVGNSLALELNGQHIFLPLEQEASAHALSAIIALSGNYRSGNQIRTDKGLLQNQAHGIEILKKLFVNSWPRQGSLKSRRKKIEFAGAGRELDEGWTPQTVAELFDGRVTEATVRYYARQLSKIPATVEGAKIDTFGKGNPYAWNSVKVTRLLNHMIRYCPTVRKMKIKNIQQLFDNSATN